MINEFKKEFYKGTTMNNVCVCDVKRMREMLKTGNAK